MSKKKADMSQDEILKKSLSDKKYRETNREKINTKMKMWYKINKEKIKEKPLCSYTNRYVKKNKF